MKLSQALQGLSDTAQIKSSSGFGIYSDSNKPTGFLSGLRMGFSAIFRSKTEESSFREGYNAALRSIREDSSLSPGAAARFEEQFGSRYDKSSPLTAGRIKAFFAVEHKLKAKEIASRLEGLENKISESSGDALQLLDTLDSLRTLRQEVPPDNPYAKRLMNEIYALEHSIKRSLEIVDPHRSPRSAQTIRSAPSDQAPALQSRVDNLGPKVANLQGNADRFGEVLTDIYETFDQARDSKADKHTTQQITDARNDLFKNFGICDNDGQPTPGLEIKHLNAIITLGKVQAERRICEKNGTPISPERETQLQEKEAKAYEAFEEALSRYPAQRQVVLQAGAEIRQNIAKGINLPEKKYGFGNNIPQLQQKPAEVLEKLLSTRKLGDDYFEFDAS
jgi:hypothetical protein